MENSKIKLNVLGITFSQVQAGAYALVLAEENGLRRVPIIIGTPEAQSIAIFLEGLHPPRPLTHDLFVTFMSKVNVLLKEIFIYKFSDGVFYSELVFSSEGQEIKIDSRTSDAIALAIRSGSPIYTTDEIMQEAGIVIEEDDDDFEDFDNSRKNQTSQTQQHLSEKLSKEELQKALNEAISMEDYEKASKLRDLLNKKKS
ncbi:MAG: bifunctional nuclease family protein [Dysgonamonadaceae bacterium]|jgi:bifunctional DNase/RNase|nr:bifunctional nuclease family protein [Dysgonamonadaceae bacterium]